MRGVKLGTTKEERDSNKEPQALSSLEQGSRQSILCPRTDQEKPVFRIRIHVFLGLPDPDPLVRGMDPDPALDPDPGPSIIKQIYSKKNLIVRKTLISTVL